jgi:hypothetical protein
MKYVISENRLNQFIIGYLNDIIERKVVNRLHPYIVISQRIGDDEDDWEDIIEFDHTDGRLWVNRNLQKMLTDMFALSQERMKVLLKQWFENKFNVKIEFVEP